MFEQLMLRLFPKRLDLSRKEKTRIYMRGYMRKYTKSEKWKKYSNDWHRKYRQTPKGKTYSKEYNQRPDVIACRIIRQRTPEYRAKMKEWRTSPQGIKWRLEHYQRNKVKICAQHMEWYYRRKERLKNAA